MCVRVCVRVLECECVKHMTFHLRSLLIWTFLSEINTGSLEFPEHPSCSHLHTNPLTHTYKSMDIYSAVVTRNRSHMVVWNWHSDDAKNNPASFMGPYMWFCMVWLQIRFNLHSWHSGFQTDFLLSSQPFVSIGFIFLQRLEACFG